MKYLVLAAAALVLLPAACVAVITAPLAGRYVPQVTPGVVALYRTAIATVEAEVLAETTGGRPGISIPLGELIAIDAVRFEQDFTRATPAAAEALAWEFAERHEEAYSPCNPSELLSIRGPTDPERLQELCGPQTHVWYTLRSLDEVMERLGLTSEQRQWVRDLLDTLRRRPEILTLGG